MTGEALGKYKILRDGIIRIMNDQCTHFLGLWSHEGGVEVEKNLWWPSPWLGWEYGVANSIPLHSRLFISELIRKDSWSKFAGETPHIMYSTVNFTERLREVLTDLSALG